MKYFTFTLSLLCLLITFPASAAEISESHVKGFYDTVNAALSQHPADPSIVPYLEKHLAEGFTHSDTYMDNKLSPPQETTKSMTKQQMLDVFAAKTKPEYPKEDAQIDMVSMATGEDKTTAEVKHTLTMSAMKENADQNGLIVQETKVVKFDCVDNFKMNEDTLQLQSCSCRVQQ